jgi:NAD(P)-dependent dehydrogenase (short-subunit alcohol dehydrogenase family)
MVQHPALVRNNVVVITGGADGIGKAAASRFTAMGMRVCIADLNEEKLAATKEEIGDVLTVQTDVSDMDSVAALKETVYGRWGQVDVLMNNAGAGFGTNSFDGYDKWRATLETNLFGVIHGNQCFLNDMLSQETPGLVINTGSKQGITNPPGDPAYNASKAAIKSLTEHLQHDLRSLEGCQVSAHLLVPGFTYSGMISQWLPEKPEGAWWPGQVIDFMLDGIARGDFYILCPDNDVDRETDCKRMQWAMGDIAENRPPLSRWHPEFTQEFAAFMNTGRASG